MAARGRRPPQADGTGKESGSHGAWPCGWGLIPMAFEKWSHPRHTPLTPRHPDLELQGAQHCPVRSPRGSCGCPISYPIPLPQSSFTGANSRTPGSLSDGRGQSRVRHSAQNSLLAPETSTCLGRSQVPHLRSSLERLLRKLPCAPPACPQSVPGGHPSR